MLPSVEGDLSQRITGVLLLIYVGILNAEPETQKYVMRDRVGAIVCPTGLVNTLRKCV